MDLGDYITIFCVRAKTQIEVIPSWRKGERILAKINDIGEIRMKRKYAAMPKSARKVVIKGSLKENMQ